MSLFNCNLAPSQPNPQDLKEALARAITRCSSSHQLCRLHSRAITSGFRYNLYLVSLLLTKYFHFGDTLTARSVFDDGRRGGPTKSLLWNSLIKGYLKHGQPMAVGNVYREMVAPHSVQCEPDCLTFHLVITACTQSSDFTLGSRVAEHARAKGLHSDLLVGTVLVDMYCKAGEIEVARRAFDGMFCRDVVTWNALIAGYSRAGLFHEAVGLFNAMRRDHRVITSEATLVSLTSGCFYSSLKDGQTLHAYAGKLGLGASLFVLNALIDMYLNFNCLSMACQLFNNMWIKDVITWSTMIGGYVQHKQPQDALKLFKWMAVDMLIHPTKSILINVILACADLGDLKEGMLIVDKYLSSTDYGMASDSSLITVLAFMYAKCGKLDASLSLINGVTEVGGDVIAWNSVMKACAEIGMVNEVLELALKMQRRGISPDQVTIFTLLSAVSCIPSLMKAMETHSNIIKRGFEIDRKVANSLIDAYAKSGSISYSIKAFDGILDKEVVSWSIMIKAYVWNGKITEAFDHFDLMREKDVTPNHFTFLSLLSACSHAGLVEKGWELFNCMKEEYSLEPGIEHLTCIVDMLCRAAKLPEAYNLLVNTMHEVKSRAVFWGTLLGACRLHGDVLIGEAAAKQLFQLEPANVANYKMLADIYVSAGRRDDANSVLRLLQTNGLGSIPGFSWYDGG